MPHYKYKKIVEKGANGTTIVHRDEEDNKILTLGEIDGFTYIYSEMVLVNQHKKLLFTQISLSALEIQELEKQRFVNNALSDDTFKNVFMKSTVEATVAKLLDDEARKCGYDGIVSACSYVGSANFGDEAKSFLDWRDAVWAYLFNVNKDIEEGNRSVPTLGELIEELPDRE